MTDWEFLEKQRDSRGLSQKEMAGLLGLKSQQAYNEYGTRKGPFRPSTIKKFKEKLKLKNWNNKSVSDDYSLMMALYSKIVELEKKLTGKTEKQIKDEIKEIAKRFQ